MSGRRVLVTGATGFLGAHLTRALVERGDRVAVLLRETSDPRRIAPWLERIETVYGDLGEIEAAAPAIRDLAPEIVYHLGWHGVGNRHRYDRRHLSVNLPGSLALLEMALEGGCRTWIGLGSQAEYGVHDGAVDERAPTEPVTLYGSSKLATCVLTRQICAAAGTRFAWIRLFSCYGPDDNPGWFIPMLIQALLAGESPALTAGAQRWDYLYIDDAVDALVAVGEQPEAEGVFNLGSGHALPIREIATRIGKLVDPRIALRLGDRPYDDNQVMHLEADVSRLRETTGWVPRVGIDEGLARTVTYYRRARVARATHEES